MLLFDMHADVFGRNRPPEESLHQKCRTFRAESDSSTLEVPGGLLVVVFEAYRQTLEPLFVSKGMSGWLVDPATNWPPWGTPCWGGENTLSRGSLGGSSPPLSPPGLGVPPMAPLRGPS